MWAKEMSGLATDTPKSRPVSAWGKNPLGMTQASAKVSAKVAQVSAKVSPWRASTQSKPRP